MVIFPFESKIGFNNKEYIKKQTKALLERANKFNKLYLEVGGKLIDDYHAAKVLPGYDTNAKISIIKNLMKKKSVEFLICLNARAFEEERRTGGFNLSYGEFTLRLIKILKAYKFKVKNAVITFYEDQEKVKKFSLSLKKLGFNIYYLPFIKGYPFNTEKILSEEGFGKKPFIKTESEVVIITAPSPNSGKMATALAMIYQDRLNGIDSGYAKLETFPVYNLSINSYINIAYEAATADINDYNVIDPYYKKAYGKESVSYNRDVKAFALLKELIKNVISEKNFMHEYKSPTDMGVNAIKEAITNMELCEKAAKQEIIRRYFKYYVDFLRGKRNKEEYLTVEKIMKKHNISIDERICLKEARDLSKKTNKKACVIKIGKKLVSAYENKDFDALLNVMIKVLSKIGIIEKDELIKNLKKKFVLKKKIGIYDFQEKIGLNELVDFILINEKTKNKIKKLEILRGSELHSTSIINEDDENILLKLGINATSEDFFSK
jgi:uncharacterized protein (UPF0371 family)